ncbi:MAG: polysulfide reductase NrfD [Gammaproteobacteria bacterium]|nr:polysulfide reductase NrfD [Gammaproteobacteria bacterium]
MQNTFGNTQQTQWDWRAAGNFMFGGSGGALVLMAAIASWPGVPNLVVGLVALGFVGLGLFLVWLEIGRPWRFLHVFFHPQTSWMTREASVSVLLFAATLSGVLLQTPALLAAAGLLGFLFLYCQGRILRASKGIPAWREPAVTPLIMSTGLAEGAGMLSILLIFSGAGEMWLLYLLMGLLAWRLASWSYYKQRLAANNAPAAALQALDSVNRPHVILGNALPLLLLLTVAVMPDLLQPLALLACILATLSGWLLKFTIITRAAKVQGYALGKLQQGRPTIKPPVRREKDRFVFDRD